MMTKQSEHVLYIFDDGMHFIFIKTSKHFYEKEKEFLSQVFG